MQSRRAIVVLVASAFAALAGILGGSTAFAAPAVVNVAVDTTTDPNVSIPVSNCNSPCSLRKATLYANQVSSSTVAVVIHLPAGNYTLRRQPEGPEGDQADVGQGGDLHLGGLTEVRGAGASSTIIEQGVDGHGDPVLDRVLLVTGHVKVSGVTIRGGHVGSGSNGYFAQNRGGGVLIDRRSPSAFFNAELTLTDSVVTGNRADLNPLDQFASGFGGGIMLENGSAFLDRDLIDRNIAGQAGGGIASSGTLSVFESTVANNRASQGGGIYGQNRTTGLTNSTVTGNRANQGGGIFTDGGFVRINLSTLASNHALADEGGGLQVAPYGSIEIADSIVATDPTRPRALQQNCKSQDPNYTITSLGNNLEDEHTCDFGQTNDLSDTDPQLLPLAMNGGSTPTMALKPTSPAIDLIAVDSTFTYPDLTTLPTGCPPPADDQRGIRRASPANGTGTRCDIGAFEYQGAVAARVLRTVTIPGRPGLPAAGSGPAAAGSDGGLQLQLLVLAIGAITGFGAAALAHRLNGAASSG